MKKTVYISLFTALIASGAFIRIPLPPVPVTLQTLFVYLAGLLLPLKLSFSSVALYLLLGLAGLPVFTTGGGPAALVGPTGGYLIGLIPAVAVLSISGNRNNIANIIVCILASLCIYVPGLFRLKSTLSLSWQGTISAGLLPFLPGDILKIAVALTAASALREKMNRLFRTPVQQEHRNSSRSALSNPQ